MKKPDLCCEYPEHISPLVEGMIRIPQHSRRAWQRKDIDSPVLSQWLINCPHVHPAWSYWLVSLIHLRPTEGVPLQVKLRTTSEYEIVTLVVDPAHLPDPDQVIAVLDNPPIRRQFGGIGDVEAIEIAESCVLACIGNHLTPDSDCRRRWDRFIDGYIQALVTKTAITENTV